MIYKDIENNKSTFPLFDSDMAPSPTLKPSHVVLDLMYTEEEGQESFYGTYQECEDFISEQSQCSMGCTYKTVPNV